MERVSLSGRAKLTGSLRAILAEHKGTHGSVANGSLSGEVLIIWIISWGFACKWFGLLVSTH